MDTNLSCQPVPKVGTKIRVTMSSRYKYDGITREGTVVHVFPAHEEIPEPLMRKYYNPKPGSKYDQRPHMLCAAGKYDRVVVKVGRNHYVIYPHQRYFWYEEIKCSR